MKELADAITEQDWRGLVDMPEYQSMQHLDQFVSCISSLMTIPDPYQLFKPPIRLLSPTWVTPATIRIQPRQQAHSPRSPPT